MKCSCNDWKISVSQMDRAFMMASLHGDLYTGSIFKFCPWCGNRLIDDEANDTIDLDKAAHDIALDYEAG